MNKLAAILYFSGLTINDIINLRASAFPLDRIYYRREKNEYNQRHNLRKRNEDHKASHPYTDRDNTRRNGIKQSIFKGAAEVLLKAQYQTKAGFWMYLHHERNFMVANPNRKWQAKNAPWQVEPRSRMSAFERSIRKQEALKKRTEKQSTHCPIQAQERRAFESSANRY